DLNFPDVQAGLEALNRLRRNVDPRIRQIPVFAYSISRDQTNIAAVQMRGGNGYYHKLDHPDTFWEALAAIDGAKGAHWPQPRESTDIDERFRPANDLLVE